MKNLKYLVFAIIFAAGFGTAYGQKTPPVPNKPPTDQILQVTTIMQRDCKNFLGRPKQSLCSTEESYKMCVGLLKQGSWDFCSYTGNRLMRAKRSTAAEAKQDLLKKNCKEISPLKFQCADTDYSVTAAGYLECIGYQNGTPGITCTAPPDLLSIYADKIEAGLKNKPVGYAFVVSNDNGQTVERAWGAARKSPDTSPMAMSINSKYTLASVSKNITAAALLKLLSKKNISVTSKILPYLPESWTIPESFKATTFEDLLTHKSGIRCESGDYTFHGLKDCVAKGVSSKDKTTDCNGNSLTQPPQIGCYRNENYALIRILIPQINGDLNTNEVISDVSQFYGIKYINYVNKEILAPAQIKALCKPTDGNQQPLTYKLSAPKGKGTDFGDMTTVCGSQGWFMNTAMLSEYFSRLNRSEEILPKKVAEQMREKLYGYTNKAEFDTKYGKIFRWWHTGYHPASSNPGEINAIVMRFSNGVQIAFIMNSDLPAGSDYGSVLTNAMYSALNE